jgi:mannose-1-phosphate guanylyltransferase/mannose-6-phosphate isomerase
LAAALVAAPDDILVILPADHLITDLEGFRQAVTRAAPHAESGAIVTFGISPAGPETGYGYLEIGEPVGDAIAVRRFKEKPDAEEAHRLSTDGRHLWNSGMFVTRADTLLAETRRHCPGVSSGVVAALPLEGGETIELAPSFEGVEAISVDHAVMEKTSHALVIPIDVGWNDIGSYRSLLSATVKDGEGNHLEGDVTVVDVSGSFISAASRKVAVVGLSDVVVVETPDAVLVLPLDRSQDVGELSKQAQES